MKKVRVGVIGAARGESMIEYCKICDHAELVAICDKNTALLEKHKALSPDLNIAYYEDYDEFLNHDMDAVVLANYATQHAPFALKAIKKGLHIFSEVSPCQTLKEAVELVEALEETGLVYTYAENYCYLRATTEMRKLYEQGKIGEFEYGECEYIHNAETIWPDITYGEENHWRNRLYSTFYCTHSLGPIIHATKLRPVSVTGIEATKNERNLRIGKRAGQFGIEMVTLENGAIVKSVHGQLYKNSIWYSMYGSKGRMECGREDAKDGHTSKIYVNYDEFSGDYDNAKYEAYAPEYDVKSPEGFGHDGSDFYTMYNFIERILGDENADTIDVYEALDMFLPGLFAYRSILKGSVPVEIPNLRNKEERDKWRNDTACTDPKVAGDMLLPTNKNGTPDIDKGVYDHIRELFERKKAEKAEKE